MRLLSSAAVPCATIWPSSSTATPPLGRYQQLQETTTQLRGENRQLRGQLEAAAAVIERITMGNDRLRQELDAAGKVTSIGSAPSRERGPTS
jgi:hypothetical protein